MSKIEEVSPRVWGQVPKIEERVVFLRTSAKRVGGDFFRKALILLLGMFFNSSLFLGVLGFLNKRLRFIETVFLVYPAMPEYARAYFFDWHIARLTWLPFLCGIFKQGDKWGIMFAVTSTEDLFRDKNRKDDLRALVAKMEHIQQGLGANQVTYSGILPGVLKVLRIREESPESKVTVKAVLKAEALLREQKEMSEATPVIVLGGKGFIGRVLVAELLASGREVYSIDVHNENDWPQHLRGMPVIVVNVTKKAALKNYIHQFWDGATVLNEVYPEPSEEEVELLRGCGCEAFHIVGVQAKALPPFPRAYRGGIPCCAAMNREDMEVIIRSL